MKARVVGGLLEVVVLRAGSGTRTFWNFARLWWAVRFVGWGRQGRMGKPHIESYVSSRGMAMIPNDTCGETPRQLETLLADN